MMVKERLLEFIKSENLSIAKFEKSIGVSNGYIRQLRHCPSKEILKKIEDAYPRLDMNWLLTGNKLSTDFDESSLRYQQLLFTLKQREEEILFLKSIITKLNKEGV